MGAFRSCVTVLGRGGRTNYYSRPWLDACRTVGIAGSGGRGCSNDRVSDCRHGGVGLDASAGFGRWVGRWAGPDPRRRCSRHCRGDLIFPSNSD